MSKKQGSIGYKAWKKVEDSRVELQKKLMQRWRLKVGRFDWMKRGNR